MAIRQINNYQDLQDVLLSYINRSDPDLTDNLETFIFLAERKIFRRYRTQNNEKLVTIDMRAVPNPLDSTQVLLSNRIDLFEDYLETLTLQVAIWKPSPGSPADDPLKPVGGKPLERVSLTEFQRRAYRETNRAGTLRRGEPEIFARQRDTLLLHPEPEATSTEAALVTLIYYCDLSGEFDTPTSDNNVLKVAPDLYIYGALLEMEPFLKPEADEMQMIPIWKAMYEEAFDQIEMQDDQEVYSGSNNVVKSTFSGGGSNQTGFSRDGHA